jgi:pentatricopeptide repeat protein
MQSQGLQPNVTTYNTLINKANYEQGILLLKEMQSQGLQPDVITYSSLIDKGNYVQGISLLKEML